MNTPHKSPAQQAVKRHRDRLSQAGLARFEVKALQSDKDLIRRLARALAQAPQEGGLRAQIEGALQPPKVRVKGGVLASLLSAPRGEEVAFERIRSEPRKVDL